MDIQTKDGILLRNIPDGTPDDVIKARIQQIRTQSAPKKTYSIDEIVPTKQPKSSTLEDVIGGQLGAAANISSNIMYPVNWALNKAGLMENTPEQQKQSVAKTTQYGDKDSTAYQASKLVGDIAATMPVGGIMGKVAGKAGMPLLEKSLASGGMSLGGTTGNALKDIGLRVAGGSAVGGASAGLVDPNNIEAGAGIGAVAPYAIKTAGMVGKLPMKLARGTLGTMTGAGAEAINSAYNAGKQGSSEFLDNLRGKTSFDDVVDMAKQGLTKMRIDRGNQYRSGMLDISKDKSVLDFTPIDNAVNSIQNMGSYNGVQINKNASSTVNDIADKVNEWKQLNPNEFHTPEGLDALKQAIGDIRDTTQPNTAARRAADNVYNSIKDQITKQAPVYSKVMKDYADGSKAITEIEKSLSLGGKASSDTAVRKLQSVFRNNAQTNYGNRLANLDKLQANGGIDLMPSLAGQALNSWTPRGMVGAIVKGGALYGALSNPILAAKIAIAAPFASPRLVGEAAYGLGSLNKNIGNVTGMVKKPLMLNGQRGLLDVPPANYLPLSILSSQTSQQ